VLGPLQVMRDVDALEPGSPKQRALLIDLLVHHGEVVSWDQLIEDLWASSPPLPASACCRTTCRSGDSNSWHWGSPGLRHLRMPVDWLASAVMAGVGDRGQGDSSVVAGWPFAAVGDEFGWGGISGPRGPLLGSLDSIPQCPGFETPGKEGFSGRR